MYQGRKWILQFIFVMSCCACTNLYAAESISDKTPAPISGRNSTNTQQMLPADVLARVKLFSKALTQVSQALGQPEERQTIFSVSNASPREVFFEAQSMFEKANRLANEVTGDYEPLPDIQTKKIVPAHVWQLVDGALRRILSVKQHLDLSDKINELPEKDDTTPTQVFNAILQENQAINALLYRNVTPSDVFEQVTMAINAVADLLGYLKVSPRIPESPPFIPNKNASDVFERLVKCIQLLESIATKSKMMMLSLQVNESVLHRASSSNTFDLSKIIVAEVIYLNTFLPDYTALRSYMPGYKTPSEVYQRAGILLAQLTLLDKAVTEHPDWLSWHEVE